MNSDKYIPTTEGRNTEAELRKKLREAHLEISQQNHAIQQLKEALRHVINIADALDAYAEGGAYIDNEKTTITKAKGLL